MALNGVNIRESGGNVLADAYLLEEDGTALTTGTTNVSVGELQSDGTIWLLDTADDDFKSAGHSGTDYALTHRTKGLWTAAITGTNFVVGGTYYFFVSNTGANPPEQCYKWQFGGVEGNQAEPGDQMDLVNSPNATAVSAIQNGLATPTNITAGTITTVSGNVNGSVGSVTGAVGSVTGNVGGSVGSVTGGINTAAGTITTLDGLDTAQDSQHGTTQTAISNLNDPTAAAIADAVLDEALSGHATAGTLGKAISDILDDSTLLADTTIGEIATASDIPADATLIQAIRLLYMRERNNTQATSGSRSITNDAGTVVLTGTSADNGTTFTQGKLGNP